MPRGPRKKSLTGYCHLICRGVGKQVLFNEDSDYHYYLKILRHFCQECNVTLIAFCLMENHVHLLASVPQGDFSVFMKKIGISYSYYYNKKYERTGHLFQGRYLSEPVNNEQSFLAVFRYILNNPQKAGICRADAYRWSSYHLFQEPESMVDTSLLCTLIGGKDTYRKFLSVDVDDNCLEYKSNPKNDEWAKTVIRQCFGKKSGTFLQSLSKSDRNKSLRILKENGLSVRQIERLTGISRNIVQRA